MSALLGSLANSVLAIVFILGTCIFVHELGHYVAARCARMRVEEFMIGFPPRVVSFTRRETRYGLGIVPFGGFCRIAGMEPGQEAVENGFYTKPRYWQAVVIAAGAVMNVLLAVGLFTGLGIVEGVPVAYVDPPEIDTLVRGETPARQAGLLPGDSIVALDGERSCLEIAEVRAGSVAARLGLAAGDVVYRVNEEYVAVPADVPRVAAEAPGSVELAVMPSGAGPESAGEPKTITASREKLGLPDPVPPDADLAEAWGVKFGPLTVEPTRLYVMERPNRPIRLTVMRNGSELELTVTPRPESVQVQEEDGQVVREEIGQIGIVFAAVRRYDMGYALRSGLDDSQVIVKGIAGMIYRAVKGESKFEGTGIVGMAYYAHKQAQIGWGAVLSLCAIISMNLAFINLLPIPIADGGRLVLIGYEAIVRRRISSRREMAWLVAGIVFLVVAFG
ncbi:MAG: hypothetical protein FJX74_25155, partial [Armatimonadetes bacterium]|nr:hypothetical protein [Armatimonadota bacterium]